MPTRLVGREQSGRLTPPDPEPGPPPRRGWRERARRTGLFLPAFGCLAYLCAVAVWPDGILPGTALPAPLRVVVLVPAAGFVAWMLGSALRRHPPGRVASSPAYTRMLSLSAAWWTLVGLLAMLRDLRSGVWLPALGLAWLMLHRLVAAARQEARGGLVGRG